MGFREKCESQDVGSFLSGASEPVDHVVEVQIDLDSTFLSNGVRLAYPGPKSRQTDDLLSGPSQAERLEEDVRSDVSSCFEKVAGYLEGLGSIGDEAQIVDELVREPLPDELFARAGAHHQTVGAVASDTFFNMDHVDACIHSVDLIPSDQLIDRHDPVGYRVEIDELLLLLTQLGSHAQKVGILRVAYGARPFLTHGERGPRFENSVGLGRE